MAERFVFEYVLARRRESYAAQTPGPFEQRRIRVDGFAGVLETFAAAATAATTADHHRRRRIHDRRTRLHGLHGCPARKRIHRKTMKIKNVRTNQVD